MVAVRVPVDWLPLVAFPLNQPPVAVQLVALVELQVNVEVPPLAILVGFAVSVTIGGGGVTVTVAEAPVLPPGPVQVSA